MQQGPFLKFEFVVGLALALAGRWVNLWIGALAVVAGVMVMLYLPGRKAPEIQPH